jgi:hypothetical protein
MQYSEEDKLRIEIKNWEDRFDRFWDAQMRGIKKWREANPDNEMIFPDMAYLTEWLLGEINRLEKSLTKT